jgi:hypothetical protein
MQIHDVVYQPALFFVQPQNLIFRRNLVPSISQYSPNTDSLTLYTPWLLHYIHVFILQLHRLANMSVIEPQTVVKNLNSCFPNLTFLLGIHSRSSGARECVSKFLRVHDGSLHPERERVGSFVHHTLYHRIFVLCAPHLYKRKIIVLLGSYGKHFDKFNLIWNESI